MGLRCWIRLRYNKEMIVSRSQNEDVLGWMLIKNTKRLQWFRLVSRVPEDRLPNYKLYTRMEANNGRRSGGVFSEDVEQHCWCTVVTVRFAVMTLLRHYDFNMMGSSKVQILCKNNDGDKIYIPLMTQHKYVEGHNGAQSIWRTFIFGWVIDWFSW